MHTKNFFKKPIDKKFIKDIIKQTEVLTNKYLKEEIKMADNTEKRKALDMAMSQIEKQFGKGSVMKLRRI